MLCLDFETPHFLVFASTTPSLIYFSHIPAMLLSLLMGFFIFIKNKKALISQILFTLSITFSLSCFVLLITWTNNDTSIIMFVWSIFGILYLLTFFFSFYLVYLFIKQRDISLKTKIFLSLFLAPTIFFASSKYNLNVFDLKLCGITQEGRYFTNYYYIAGLAIFIWMSIVSITNYLKIKTIFRKQILLLLGGVSFFLLSLFFTGFLASLLVDYGVFSDYSVEQYGLFGMLVFLAFLSYLIIKYQAWDIKVIAAQFLTVTVWIGVFSQFFIVQELSNQILTGVTLALVTIFGYMLFRAIKEDVSLTEQLRLASGKLAILNTKLKEIDAAKSEFVSIASHQLRTPLTSVKGYASLILENTFGKIPLRQREAVEKLYVNNEKLVLLVEDMLNASRLEAGRLEYEFEEVDVPPLIKEIVDNMQLHAKSKNLLLKYTAPSKTRSASLRASSLIALADKRKVAEIIANLIDNAVKYSPALHEGQNNTAEKQTITVSVSRCELARPVGKAKNTKILNGAGVRVSVADNGIGMSEKELKEIFEKFKKGETKNEKQETGSSFIVKREKEGEIDNKIDNITGTGLGVYISRQMARAMGGDLCATSPGKGKGSTFTLELPLVKK